MELIERGNIKLLKNSMARNLYFIFQDIENATYFAQNGQNCIVVAPEHIEEFVKMIEASGKKTISYIVATENTETGEEMNKILIAFLMSKQINVYDFGIIRGTNYKNYIEYSTSNSQKS